MGKRKKWFIKTVASSLFVLLSVFLTTLYGNDVLIEDSSAEAKKNKEKIDRGLNLALEAINIAGYHTVVKNVDSKSHLKIESKKIYEALKEIANFNIESDNQESRQIHKVNKPLITEFKKTLREKNTKRHSPSIPKHYTIKIRANKPWTRTNIYLKENDIVRIYCKGKVVPGAFEYRYKNTSCRAEGYLFTRGNFTILPNANYMAAIGKIGNRDAFYIGSQREFKSYVDGHLYLGINDLKKSIYTGEPINKRSIYWKDNTGYYQADVYVYRK